MLEDNGYTLVDEYSQRSFRNTYRSYGLVNNKASSVTMISQQYSGTPCHISIWKDGTKWRVDVANGITLYDFGLRMDGKKVDYLPKSTSIETALRKKSGNKFITSDKRLSAKIGSAAVIIDGKKDTVDTQWKRSGHTITLSAELSNELLIELRYDEEDVSQGDIYSLTSVRSDPVTFTLINDSKKITTQQKGDLSFHRAYVRMMYLGDKGENVVYLYAEPIDTDRYPDSIEILFAVNTTPERSSDNSGIGGFWESSRETFTPDHSKLDCLTCNDSGKCKECGGSLYVGFGDSRGKCGSCRGLVIVLLVMVLVSDNIVNNVSLDHKRNFLYLL